MLIHSTATFIAQAAGDTKDVPELYVRQDSERGQPLFEGGARKVELAGEEVTAVGVEGSVAGEAVEAGRCS